MSYEGRGKITPEIRKRSEELLGYEISQVELRLLPYLAYVMVNEQMIDYRKVNGEEMDILNKWQDMGFLNLFSVKIRITEKFWTAINSILYLGYVAYGR